MTCPPERVKTTSTPSATTACAASRPPWSRSPIEAEPTLRAVDLDVVFIGTSGSTPTPQRALPATLIRRGGERLLFAGGEATRRAAVCGPSALPSRLSGLPRISGGLTYALEAVALEAAGALERHGYRLE